MAMDNSVAAAATDCEPSPAMRTGLETSGPSPGWRLPKKPLVSCSIEAHSIEKRASPKKKTLDPLRYMPDRASYHALFTVVARFEDDPGEYPTTRSYQQFRALHSQLLKKFPKSKLPKSMPMLRKKRFDNEYMEQKTAEMNVYLKQMLGLEEVRQSKILREFLEESPQSEDSDDDDSVTTKMLDGLPGTIVNVRAGQSFSLSLRLQNAGDVASWQFTTKKHNIGFSATFNGTNVRVYSREDSQIKPVKGSFRCSEPGTLALDWDNTYTWSKTKVLIYWAEVEQARTMSLPDLIDRNGELGSPVSPISDATPMIDGRRSGFIAHSRNSSLYPRQIVNTSLSLITKPFVGNKHDHSNLKSGSLIVERNLKFRGRNWYRKWFVLDMRKYVLRYYDSEQAFRKGLSLANLSLSTRNACLAITSNDEGAPTPYLFMVRTRKRCWKLCASSQADYNEWENALSTAILAAQIKRRKQRGPTKPENGDGDDENLDHIIDQEESDSDSDDDEEDDDEDGVKDDDEDEVESDEDEQHDSYPQMKTPVMTYLTVPGLAVPTATNESQRPSSTKSRATAPFPAADGATGARKHVPFHQHWFGQLCQVSNVKKALVLVAVNSLALSVRSCTVNTLVIPLLVANCYMVVHALEAHRRPRTSPRVVAKDKNV